jgi:cytochrome c6
MRRASALLALAVAVLALGVAGCGGAEDVTATPETIEGVVPEPENGGGEDLPALDLTGDPTAGKTVWDANGCGACHVLAAAGAAGQVGPSLDATQPSYELVVTRVTNGLGAMPAFGDSLTPQQIADVAQFVADNAGG